MPQDMAAEIAKLKSALAKLEMAHRNETTVFKKVEKAHKAEGRKVAAKRMGKAGREKLKELHAAESAALVDLGQAHLKEGGMVNHVKRFVPKVKGAPVSATKSAEAKPEPAAEPVEKRGPGRPPKLVAVVEPGMAPAALAGGAPETGPQEVAPEKKKVSLGVGPRSKLSLGIGPKNVVKMAVEEKPKEEPAKKERKPRAKKEKEEKPHMTKSDVERMSELVAKAMADELETAKKLEEVAIHVPPMKKEEPKAEAPKEKKARKPRKPMTPEQKERAKANLEKARAARAAKKGKKD